MFFIKMHGKAMNGSEKAVTCEASNNNDKNKWLEDELAGSGLKDIRLQKRFRNLEQLWDGLGQTIPFACQDWANTKAAYRFYLMIE